MECEYKKILLTNADNSKIYVCCCKKCKCYGKEPKCDYCKLKKDNNI